MYWTIWGRYMQVMYLGRAPRTKETLPDFLKWRRITRHPLVFRGLTGSQQTPGFWGVTRAFWQRSSGGEFNERQRGGSSWLQRGKPLGFLNPRAKISLGKKRKI